MRAVKIHHVTAWRWTGITCHRKCLTLNFLLRGFGKGCFGGTLETPLAQKESERFGARLYCIYVLIDI